MEKLFAALFPFLPFAPMTWGAEKCETPRFKTGWRPWSESRSDRKEYGGLRYAIRLGGKRDPIWRFHGCRQVNIAAWGEESVRRNGNFLGGLTGGLIFCHYEKFLLFMPLMRILAPAVGIEPTTN
jgi:hypothetical protein